MGGSGLKLLFNSTPQEAPARRTRAHGLGFRALGFRVCGFRV